MEKETEEKLNLGNDQFIVSTVLTEQEYLSFLELRDSIGISSSHLGRALIRFGVQSVEGINEDAKGALLLRLIKLGK